jgi:saxitoxin biosynthesis operon SxtJ-like protein
VAERIRARLTAAEGRRFGLTVGAAFAVFAGIAWWRAHPTVSTVLGSLGGVLILAGLIIPTLLGPVERAWMGLAHLISKVTTPIVMGVMYLLVITPVGVLRRRLGGNPLVHAPAERSFWRTRPENGRRTASLSRQF